MVLFGAIKVYKRKKLQQVGKLIGNRGFYKTRCMWAILKSGSCIFGFFIMDTNKRVSVVTHISK